MPWFGRAVVIKMAFKSPKLVVFNFYVQIMPRRFLVDTTCVCMCCVKQLAIKTKYFHSC